MSVQTVGQRFVELCNHGKNFDVMREMYTEDMVSVESSGQATSGKAAVIKKSEVWASGITIHGEKVLGPFVHGASQFAVHFTFDITPKSTGQRVTQSEVGVYTVNKDDKITREEFFNEGNW